MKRSILLFAANEAPASMPAVCLPTPESAANARIIEGMLRIPFGLWPTTVVNEDDKPEKVLQRLDRPVSERLIGAFNSARGRFARLFSGCRIYRGHPDYNQAVDAAAWAPLGRVTRLMAEDAALVAEADLPDTTKALLAANEALAPSPHWGLRRTGETIDGMAVCEPVALYSFGLTARPNIAGAAVNEEGAPDPEVQNLSEQAQRERELVVLAAEIAELEAKLSALESARYAAEQALAERDASVQGMRAQIEALQAQIAAAREEEQQAAAAGREAVQAAEAAQAATVAAVVAAAVESARIPEADREHWAQRVAATPAAVNELFAVPPLKRVPLADAKRISAANGDMAGTSTAQRFAELVRRRMADTHETWATAWHHCRSQHAELYRLMPNGGKA